MPPDESTKRAGRGLGFPVCSETEFPHPTRFAWNAFAFDHQIAARLDGRHQDEPVPHTLRYAVGDNRIDITLDDGGTSSLWWATKNEWLGLVDVAGLEVELLYGGFDRKPVDDDSREYVFVARRR